MNLVTTLKKHFDITEYTGCAKNSQEQYVNDVPQIWVYEKGQESEPLFILKCAQALEEGTGWIVADIYSSLEHGQRLSDAEIKALLKNGKIHSEFK